MSGRTDMQVSEQMTGQLCSLAATACSAAGHVGPCHHVRSGGVGQLIQHQKQQPLRAFDPCQQSLWPHTLLCFVCAIYDPFNVLLFVHCFNVSSTYAPMSVCFLLWCVAIWLVNPSACGIGENHCHMHRCIRMDAMPAPRTGGYIRLD